MNQPYGSTIYKYQQPVYVADAVNVYHSYTDGNVLIVLVQLLKVFYTHIIAWAKVEELSQQLQEMNMKVDELQNKMKSKNQKISRLDNSCVGEMCCHTKGLFIFCILCEYNQACR